MFIQIESTPNPATLKFLPGKTVLEEGTLDFRSSTGSEKSPLAQRLFAIPGVTGVFFGQDFITVTADVEDWSHIKPAILGGIMEHFVTGMPILVEDAEEADENDGSEFFAEDDRAMVDTIKELLETRVRPAVAQDGGDITFKGFQDGVVYLNMRGACAGCPSSTATLKNGIENLLRHFVPGVEEVRAS
ncbi:NifU family protein [Ahrensia marina]|jgi:Fe-S cluster biogenesis protein NfuA|uniref:NifU family protein n=1 Tax=Ahrensia marina TaxID=1514904 RepID=UPI0035D11381